MSTKTAERRQWELPSSLKVALDPPNQILTALSLGSLLHALRLVDWRDILGVIYRTYASFLETCGSGLSDLLNWDVPAFWLHIAVMYSVFGRAYLMMEKHNWEELTWKSRGAAIVWPAAIALALFDSAKTHFRLWRRQAYLDRHPEDMEGRRRLRIRMITRGPKDTRLVFGFALAQAIFLLVLIFVNQRLLP